MDVEPDSTTVEREVNGREFVVDDEVLCDIPPGDQLYLGVVVEVNHILKKCLVRFLDETETWCRFADMKYFNLGENEVTCVVCKSSHPAHQLVVCPCGRGYHQRCHQPPIPSRDGTFRCRICSPARRREGVIAVSQCVPSQVTEKQECPSCHKKDLWYNGMLQCRRCKLWHHCACLTTLKQQPIPGDRFFILVCPSCNEGHEYCQRMPLTWPDVVHLALFNLSLQQHTKYHDIDEAIVPFLRRVWINLQLQPEMAQSTGVALRRNVETALQSCTKRFRCGKEAKKRASLWSLKVRNAPRPPPVSLPSRGVMPLHLPNHQELPAAEPPLQNGLVNSSSPSPRKTKKELSSVKSPRPIIPAWRINFGIFNRKDDDLKGDKIKSSKKNGAIHCDSKVEAVAVESSTEFHGRGLVKRSVPFPLTEPSTSSDRFRSAAVRRARRMLRKQTNRPAKFRESYRLSDSEDEAIRTLLKPIAVNGKKDNGNFSKKEVRKRPQRNLLEARLNSTESKLYNPANANPATSSTEPSPVKKKGKKMEILKGKRKNGFIESLGRTEEGDSNSSGDEKPKEVVPIKRRLSEVGSRKRKRLKRPAVQPVLLMADAACHAELFGGPVDVSMVRELLGPLARVERGDSYNVVSRRVLPDGQVEVMLDFTD